MEKRKLITGTVHKPVNDTRMYEKFSLSPGQTNKYGINIIGFAIKNSSKEGEPGIIRTNGSKVGHTKTFKSLRIFQSNRMQASAFVSKGKSLLN